MNKRLLSASLAVSLTTSAVIPVTMKEVYCTVLLLLKVKTHEYAL
ncbi:hypothetical protein [Lysinibacillus sp. NPDC093692]